MGKLSQSNSNSSPQHNSFREERVQVRRDYTDACKSKGADKEGIAKGTNKIYDRIFPEGRPDGDRDDWSRTDQGKTMVGEHMATKRVNELDTPAEGSSQREANNRVVEASKQGASQAADMINDKECGGFFGWLFGSHDD